MDIIYITQEDEKLAEKDCYDFINKEIKPYLEWINNNNFENKYRLNSKGEKRYPELKGEIFFIDQIEKFVFQLGKINPFEMCISKLNQCKILNEAKIIK